MHDNNIYHHDLTKRNILITPSSKQVFSFVDNNRMSFVEMSLKMRMESLSKLSNNVNELHALANLYGKYSNYSSQRCIDFIDKGFRKANAIKTLKNFLRETKKAPSTRRLFLLEVIRDNYYCML